MLRTTITAALLVAGGHSLIPMMKLRMALPEHLVDLQDLEALKSIKISDGQISLGAMVTQSELIASQKLNAACPIICETALQIADPQVRNRATVAVNLAHGDPANDHPATMLALGAEVVIDPSGFAGAGWGSMFFPGKAGIFLIYYPGNEVDGRQVRFIEKNPKRLEFWSRFGGERLKDLMIPPPQG